MDFSVLNPNGPFVLLNPVSKLPAGQTHVLVLSFSPHESMLVRPRPPLRPLSVPPALGLGPASPPGPWSSPAERGGRGSQGGLGPIMSRPGGSQHGAAACA